MRWRILFLLLFFATAVVARAEENRGAADFAAYSVEVDSGADPLAAYQVELDAGRTARIAGVEGGAHAAYAEPPYYDPAALRGGRIILAAFSTSSRLPVGRTRVAVLHMQLTGSTPPQWKTRVTAAATMGGRRIEAMVSVHRFEPRTGTATH